MSDPFDGPAPRAANGRFDDIPRDRWDRPQVVSPVSGVVETFTSASTLGSTLADFYNLNQWQLRNVARGMAIGTDELIALASVTPTDGPGCIARYKSEIIEPALDRAGANVGRVKGTSLHAAAQSWLGGTPREMLPAWTKPSLDALAVELTRQAVTVDPTLLEVFTVAPEVQAAGSADYARLTRADWAKPRVGDLKTQKDHPEKWNALEIAVQLAIYAHGLNDHGVRQSDGSFTPIEGGIDLETAIIVWLPVIGESAGQCHLLTIDIAHGWTLAKMAVRVRQERTAAKRLVSALALPAAPTGDTIESVFGQPGTVEQKLDEAFKATRPRRTKAQLAAAGALADARGAGCVCPGDDHLGTYTVIEACPVHGRTPDGDVADVADFTETIEQTANGHHVHEALDQATQPVAGPGVAAAVAAGEAARRDQVFAELHEINAGKTTVLPARLAQVDPIVRIRARIMAAKTATDLSNIWREHEKEWTPELTALGRNRRLPVS